MMSLWVNIPVVSYEGNVHLVVVGKLWSIESYCGALMDSEKGSESKLMPIVKNCPPRKKLVMAIWEITLIRFKSGLGGLVR